MSGDRAPEPYEDLVGRTASLTRTVTDDDTASALGSGDVPVLATPRLVAWCEAATVAALTALPDGLTSVGTRVEVDHLAASPTGADVTCHAAVTAADGRLLTLEVLATQAAGGEPQVVARAVVVRAVVDRARFLARVPGPGG